MYAARYAYDDDNCRFSTTAVPEGVRAAGSRDAVATVGGPHAVAHPRATRALLVVVFVVALAVLASATFPGYFQSQVPVLFQPYARAGVAARVFAPIKNVRAAVHDGLFCMHAGSLLRRERAAFHRRRRTAAGYS